MCAICGIIDWGRRRGEVRESLIRKMCQVVRHRGPDDEGIHVDQSGEGRISLGLGHRRLSIIDLETGHQPMTNEDQSAWIVANGEVYNFQELARDLKARGHVFRTRTDTEVILHLYEEKGSDCLPDLRGMYAFAIWDKRQRQLFLARDRLGQKPLFYSAGKERFIFASDLKSILQVPGVKREVDPEAIDAFLSLQYIPSPGTIFPDIKKLPPAHYLIWRDGRINIKRYWDLSFREKTRLKESECLEKISELARESTKMRLISDVPLGAFLSGGVDSTLVVGLAAGLTKEPVKTFSIGFPERTHNELRYARLAGKRHHTDYREFLVKPEAAEVLPQLVWHYGEPFGDSSALPTYYVAKVTSEFVKVALNGDGGDESFGGYARYRAVKLAGYYDRLPPVMRKVLPRWFPGGPNLPRLLRRAKRFQGALSLPPPVRYARWIGIFDEERKRNIYSAGMRARVEPLQGISHLLSAYERADGPDFLDRTFYVDITTYLPGALLVKMDVATMANSLEARAPFLDHKLMEFAATLPSSWKLRGMHTKYILKKALGELLPPEIRRRPKMGFGVPIGNWFRTDLKQYVRDILLDPRARQRGYFEPKMVERLLSEHFSGYPHEYRLWALLNLELWHRIFIDRSPSQSPEGVSL